MTSFALSAIGTRFICQWQRWPFLSPGFPTQASRGYYSTCLQTAGSPALHIYSPQLLLQASRDDRLFVINFEGTEDVLGFAITRSFRQLMHRTSRGSKLEWPSWKPHIVQHLPNGQASYSNLPSDGNASTGWSSPDSPSLTTSLTGQGMLGNITVCLYDFNRRCIQESGLADVLDESPDPSRVETIKTSIFADGDIVLAARNAWERDIVLPLRTETLPVPGGDNVPVSVIDTTLWDDGIILVVQLRTTSSGLFNPSLNYDLRVDFHEPTETVHHLFYLMETLRGGVVHPCIPHGFESKIDGHGGFC